MTHPARQLRVRNHYVPASYLANFTRERTRAGRVWVYSRDSPAKPKHLPLDYVGLVKRLYIRDDGAGPDDVMERHLADQVEGPFAKVLRRIMKSFRMGMVPSMDALAGADREVLARFLAFQLLRSPVERDASQWMGELSNVRFIRENLAPPADLRRLLDQATGGTLSSEQEASIFQHLLDRFRPAAEDWLPRTRRNAERFAKVIERLEWHLIRVPTPVELVTCDMPLVCVRRGAAPGEYTLGGAIAEPDFEATLTLSPWLFLLVTHRVEDPATLRTAAFAESVRQRTIEHAHRWVYGFSRDSRTGDALAASPQPEYYIEFHGRVFRVGHPVLEIEGEAARVGATSLNFRYGDPERDRREVPEPSSDGSSTN